MVADCGTSRNPDATQTRRTFLGLAAHHAKALVIEKPQINGAVHSGRLACRQNGKICVL